MKAGLILVVCCSLFPAIWSMDPVVMTTKGLVRGAKATDGNYLQFLGIPYAVVDRENPFGNAKPLSHFAEVFVAQTESPVCPQRSFFNDQISGSLDCLSVNVYVPQHNDATNKFPVMVWIFGGGFVGGSNSKDEFGPQYLVRHGVILVTVNYRLGPYGFMCLNIPSVPGNTGLKDQQIALKWVHDNIGAFGGDAEKVTIFGQSAGSGSCEYHILNPVSNKLFSQAILQSGTVFTDGMIERPDPSVPFTLAKNMGFNPESIEEALAILKNSSTNDVILAGKDFPFNYYKPCIEKEFEDVEGFLVTSPLKILESKDYRGVTMMIGHNSQESIQAGKSIDIYDTLKIRFNFTDTNDLDTAAKVVKDFYIKHNPATERDEIGVSNFNSDFVNNYGADRAIKYHVAQSEKPVYQYVFGYVGSHSSGPMRRQRKPFETGVGHSGELSYLFKRAGDENTPHDRLVIDRFTKMWTNFAKYGNPTPEVTKLLPFKWPAVDKEKRDFMWIGGELHVDQRVFHERMAFWDLFFVAYGKDYWLY